MAVIPRSWIRAQLREEYELGHQRGLDTRIAQHRQRQTKWTKGHLVIGFVQATAADLMFRAQDELTNFVNSAKFIRCKTVGVDIAAKEVFCELATSRGLEDLLAEMEAACPSLAEGSASAGRFVRTM